MGFFVEVLKFLAPIASVVCSCVSVYCFRFRKIKLGFLLVAIAVISFIVFAIIVNAEREALRQLLY